MQDNQGTVAIMLSPPLTHWFELTLARALDLKRKGTPLCVLYCNGKTKGCAANPFCISSICSHCRVVRDAAIQESLGDVVALALMSLTHKKCRNQNSCMGFNPVKEQYAMELLQQLKHFIELIFLLWRQKTGFADIFLVRLREILRHIVSIYTFARLAL